MSFVELLRALSTQGMGVLREIRGLDKQALTELGISQSTAGSWQKLSNIYFGPTKFTRQQRLAVEAGETSRLSLEAIQKIEKHVAKLTTGKTWQLRRELCQLTGTVDEIDRKAAARVRELNRAAGLGESHAFRRRAVRGGKNTDALGCRTITVTGPERLMAHLLGGVDKTARKLRRQNPKLSFEQARFDALIAGDRVAEKITPLVAIGLPDWAKVLRHEADETIFALTDGTTMTGAELVGYLMGGEHKVGIYSPTDGPVNLYRSERNANQKQRELLAAESILCENPDCTTPADSSQIHHINAWRFGGNTNADEMTVLCSPHNGRNDDNPDGPVIHGRAERRNGQVVWVSGSDPPRRNNHPIKDLSAAALAQRQFAGPSPPMPR